ncbi:MAG: sulfite exporter TauE/SafE family protein [Verrucomicrobiota bacterium]|jgi:sulfite exporter TauE/SafE
MELGLVFALGMLGSLHCAAMCGPLMLALPTPPGGAARFIIGRIIYQLGRILTYAMLGVAAGIVGRSLFLIGLQRWLCVALGLAVLAGFFLSKTISLSAPVLRLVGKLKGAMSSQLQQRSYRSLTLLGMLNGLLPCGLVYVAMAGAASSGTIFSGVGFMALFGLGTVPAMLSISLWGKLLHEPLRWKLRRAIPFGVCGLAVLLILRGMALGIPYLSPNLAAGASGCCVH